MIPLLHRQSVVPRALHWQICRGSTPAASCPEIVGFAPPGIEFKFVIVAHQQLRVSLPGVIVSKSRKPWLGATTHSWYGCSDGTTPQIVIKVSHSSDIQQHAAVNEARLNALHSPIFARFLLSRLLFARFSSTHIR